MSDGSPDELDVKMRVTLDDDDIAKQIAGAERKIRDGVGPGKATSPPPAPPAASAANKSLGKAIADAIHEQQSKVAGGKMAAFGEMAMPLAAGVLGLQLLKDLKAALQSVLQNLLALGGSLSRFNPELAVAFRGMSVEMRKLAIDMGRTLGPVLADLVRTVTEIVRLAYMLLKPLLMAMAAALRLVLDRVQMVVAFFKLLASAVANAVWMLAKLASSLADLVTLVSPALGASMKMAAEALAKASEKWLEALDGSRKPENLMNMMLIKGLTEAANTKTDLPGRSHEFGRANNERPAFLMEQSPRMPHANRDGSPSLVSGRVAAPTPAPKLASMVTNVRHSTEVRLESEQAVSRAMEEVRRVLTSAVLRVRNDQLMLANRLAGETVVDLVG